MFKYCICNWWIFTVVASFTYKIAPSSTFPSDWKAYIHPDMLYQYLGEEADDKINPGYFEGDIAGDEGNYSQTQLVELTGNVSEGTRFRWPEGTVPFIISPTLGTEENAAVRTAMAVVSKMTNDCVKFVNRTDQADYVEFVAGLSCSSPVGRQGQKQRITLTHNCIKSSGDVQHEIMHTLGFFHELSRTDRDEYVWINWDNIRQENFKHFQSYTNATMGDLPYDYESLLHFPFSAFAVDATKPTIVPKVKNAKIGQFKTLSQLDVARIRKEYRCDKTAILSSTRQTKMLQEGSQNVVPLPIFGQPVFFYLTTTPSPANQTTPASMNQTTPSSVNQTSTLPLIIIQPTTKAFRNKCPVLDTDNCEITYLYNDCSKNFLKANCTTNASNREITSVMENIKRVDRKQAAVVEVRISGQRKLNPDLLTPVKTKIIALSLYNSSGLRVSALCALDLPNLIDLTIGMSTNLQILYGDLDCFPKLRVLTFEECMFTLIEEGSFDKLPFLQQLSLEYYTDVPVVKAAQVDQLWQFHCDCQYLWLRTLFRNRPYLLDARRDGEMYNISGRYSEGSRRIDIFSPVDCAKEELLNLFQNQTDYSTNEQCDQDSTASPGNNRKAREVYVIEPVQPAARTSSRLKNPKPFYFRMDDVSESECNALNTPNCIVSSNSANCTDYFFYLICSENATDSEFSWSIKNIARLNKDRPVFADIYSRISLVPELFAPIKNNIIQLLITNNSELVSGTLRNLDLPSLVSLTIKSFQNLQVSKGDFAVFPKLRALFFVECSFSLVEEGSFENLPALQLLSLEHHSEYEPFTVAQKEQLWTLHCDCRYLWVRNLFRDRPYLLKERTRGELYDIGNFVSDSVDQRKIFVPVDCGKDDLILESPSQSQVFSLHDKCDPEYTDTGNVGMNPGNSNKVLAAQHMNVKPQFFGMRNVSLEECQSLDTENCIVSSNSENCTNYYFRVVCERATNNEVTLSMQRIELLDRDRPISVTVSGENVISSKMFAPVKDNVVFLGIKNNSAFSMSSLWHLELPNLVDLKMSNLDNLQLQKGDFGAFPKLRMLRFHHCSFSTVEKGCFEELPALQQLSLEYRDQPDERGLSTVAQKAQLGRLHCGCQYVWLRDFFRDRPYLLQQRRQGEIYSFGNCQNQGDKKGDIFVAVDCQNDNLVSVPDGTSYSVNDKCGKPILKQPTSQADRFYVINYKFLFVYVIFAICFIQFC